MKKRARAPRALTGEPPCARFTPMADQGAGHGSNTLRHWPFASVAIIAA